MQTEEFSPMHQNNTVPFLQRVAIQNYKSISNCNVTLRQFAILVGRNGSGKSNFLDALRFVSDGLNTSLDHAIKSRGGIDEVRRRSTGHPRNFSIQLTLALPDGRPAMYSFEVSAKPHGGFVVKKEELKCNNASYRVEAGKLRSGPNGNDENGLFAGSDALPSASPDRLYLVNVSGLPRFRPIYESLLRTGFYNLNPEAMRKPQTPDAGELLHRDGVNIAGVLGRLEADRPNIKKRIQEYLSTIVPGIVDFRRVPVGQWETLEFRQSVEGANHPWKFFAASMSDGTLRALGTLVAVTQLADKQQSVSLVGIEEPETALHAAAAGAMMDALREAATHTQVIVTTHSPELLDQIQETDMLVVVRSRKGSTEIGPPDKACQESIREHLYTAGDLLRMDQLDVGEDDAIQQGDLQFDATETNG